jgi:hypothetical protein
MPLAPATLLHSDSLLHTRAVLDRVGYVASMDDKVRALAAAIQSAIDTFPTETEQEVARALFAVGDYAGQSPGARKNILGNKKTFISRMYSDNRVHVLNTVAFELRCPSDSGVLRDGTLTARKETDTVNDLLALDQTLSILEALSYLAVMINMAQMHWHEQDARRERPAPLRRAWSRYFLRSVAYADYCLTDAFAPNNRVAVWSLFEHHHSRSELQSSLEDFWEATKVGPPEPPYRTRQLYFEFHFPPPEATGPGVARERHDFLHGHGSDMLSDNQSLSNLAEASSELSSSLSFAEPTRYRWQEDNHDSTYKVVRNVLSECSGNGSLPPAVDLADYEADEQIASTFSDIETGLKRPDDWNYFGPVKRPRQPKQTHDGLITDTDRGLHF